jgi:hypothetical protein
VNKWDVFQIIFGPTFNQHAMVSLCTRFVSSDQIKQYRRVIIFNVCSNSIWRQELYDWAFVYISRMKGTVGQIKLFGKGREAVGFIIFYLLGDA